MVISTEICNLALSHAGVGKLISNVTTERSEEASVLKLMYPVSLGFLLRTYRFPYLEKTAALALVEEDPNDEWGFSYQYPNGAERIIRILSGFVADSSETKVNFTQGYTSTGRVIYTNQEEAQAQYVVSNPDPKYFPSDFKMAFSYHLASLVTPRLSGGDVMKITERLDSFFQFYISRCMAVAQNEETLPKVTESGFEGARR
jgi:hypothetical protein